MTNDTLSPDYKLLFRSVPATCILFNTDYTILEATDVYLRMTMRSREDIVGRNVFEAFPDNPNDTSSHNTSLLKVSIDKAIQSKQPDTMVSLRYDIPLPEEKGGGFDTRYWDVIHTPIVNTEGKVLFVTQKTMDVTEREKARNALNESEQKLKFIADALPILVWISDENGQVNYLNKKWSDYTGIPHEKLYGNSQDFVHPEDVETVKKAWIESAGKGEDFQFELRIKSADGSYRWHQSVSRPRKNAKGEIIMWVGTSIDIHDTKQMVQELLASNEKMSELADQVQEAYNEAEMERKTLEKLLMEAPAAICILRGPEHEFTLINPNYKEIFPGRQLLGKSVMEALPEIKGQGFKELLDNVYSTGETFIGREMQLMVDKNQDGILEETYFTFTYQPLYQSNEKIIGVVVFAFEVTELVQLRKKLTGMEETKI
jgi:PAS domain S-box-containing protein